MQVSSAQFEAFASREKNAGIDDLASFRQEEN
jgi:hypothetical protein